MLHCNIWASVSKKEQVMDGEIVLSSLAHTWILDLDGTIVKHNGYKIDGEDTLIPGAIDFLNSIPKDDMIVWITSRKSSERERTEKFLIRHGIRCEHMIYDAPYGERILINDDKPSGLAMAIAKRRKRDAWDNIKIRVDDNL